MRAAIIGLGGRITGVWNNLSKAAAGRISLVGYADPGPPIGLPNLQRAGVDVGRAFADHREMLRTLKPDAVLIGSPNHLHLQHLGDALDAGCRVFCEKPVVISPEDTWAAASLIAKHGADRVQIGLVLRSSPFFRTVNSLLPRLGKLVSLETRAKLRAANLGKTPSPEARAKMRLAHQNYSPEIRVKMCSGFKGKKHTPEAIAKNIAWHTGRKRKPFSAEHRAKLSVAGKGRIVTPEACANISAALTGRKKGPLSPEHRAKLSAMWQGRKFSAETRAKISAALLSLAQRKRLAKHQAEVTPC